WITAYYTDEIVHPSNPLRSWHMALDILPVGGARRKESARFHRQLSQCLGARGQVRTPNRERWHRTQLPAAAPHEAGRGDCASRRRAGAKRRLTLNARQRKTKGVPGEARMFSRKCQLLLVAGLVTGTSWAANDPFVGQWKLDPSRSKLTDEMKVTKVG